MGHDHRWRESVHKYHQQQCQEFHLGSIFYCHHLGGLGGNECILRGHSLVHRQPISPGYSPCGKVLSILYGLFGGVGEFHSMQMLRENVIN